MMLCFFDQDGQGLTSGDRFSPRQSRMRRRSVWAFPWECSSSRWEGISLTSCRSWSPRRRQSTSSRTLVGWPVSEHPDVQGSILHALMSTCLFCSGSGLTVFLDFIVRLRRHFACRMQSLMLPRLRFCTSFSISEMTLLRFPSR